MQQITKDLPGVVVPHPLTFAAGYHLKLHTPRQPNCGSVRLLETIKVSFLSGLEQMLHL